jgi:hypothetical protein
VDEALEMIFDHPSAGASGIALYLTDKDPRNIALEQSTILLRVLSTALRTGIFR